MTPTRSAVGFGRTSARLRWTLSRHAGLHPEGSRRGLPEEPWVPRSRPQDQGHAIRGRDSAFRRHVCRTGDRTVPYPRDVRPDRGLTLPRTIGSSCAKDPSEQRRHVTACRPSRHGRLARLDRDQRRTMSERQQPGGREAREAALATEPISSGLRTTRDQRQRTPPTRPAACAPQRPQGCPAPVETSWTGESHAPRQTCATTAPHADSGRSGRGPGSVVLHLRGVNAALRRRIRWRDQQRGREPEPGRAGRSRRPLWPDL